MKPTPTKPDPRAAAPLLAVQEVAHRLGISVKTVRRMIAGRHLPAHRIGRLVRVTETDLQAFVGLRRG